MLTPNFRFLKAAFLTKSADLLVGIPHSTIRRNAVHFLTMSMLLGAVLIGVRSMQLMSVEPVSGSRRVITLPGAIGLEFGWLLIYLGGMGVILFLKPSGKWCVQLTLFVALFEGFAVMLRWSLGLDPGPGGNTLAGILIVFTLGASLLPWSPRQTLGLSAIWVIGSTATLLAVTPGYEVAFGATIFGFASVAVPGIMVSFFRTTRIRDRFEIDYFQTRYERISQELSAAKSIHERAFPQPRTTGAVRFAYSYRPMSQIGGDYLFASCRNDEPDSPILIALLDVSGHGIPAALTANRLQGELMQLVGEDPLIEPDELIAALDRYICLTSPDDPVLVTGIALRVDPAMNELRIVNAGHPGALLRDTSGSLTEIDATGPLMGIDPTASIEWGMERFAFHPGDALVAFTDGITEATDDHERMFGIEGIRGVIESGWIEPGQRWPELVRRSVDRYCEGVVNDDMLIVDVYRPQGV